VHVYSSLFWLVDHSSPGSAEAGGCPMSRAFRDVGIETPNSSPGVPHVSRFSRHGNQVTHHILTCSKSLRPSPNPIYFLPMTRGLTRYYGSGHLHFITCSCYQRQPLLGSAIRRDLFLKVLEEVRQRYQFVVVGYVVMPEHFHLLISEPQDRTPSVVMQALKLGFARRILAEQQRRRGRPQSVPFEEPPQHVWQPRFYDFNIWSGRKRIEKLRYMHRNPVKRLLVSSPELWAWSSYRAYAFGERGPVRVNDWEVLRMKTRAGA
jgi:putative transposase